MLLIAGTLRLTAAARAEARDAIAAVIAATRAEDGCIAYHFAADLIDPDVLVISEAWRDAAALQEHGRSEHLRIWQDRAKALGASERALRVYETDEGRSI